jgi:hypothetical protein
MENPPGQGGARHQTTSPASATPQNHLILEHSQADLDSQDFLALNVQNSPGVYTNLPRPIPAADAAETGMFDNGLNRGRRDVREVRLIQRLEVQDSYEVSAWAVPMCCGS